MGAGGRGQRSARSDWLRGPSRPSWPRARLARQRHALPLAEFFPPLRRLLSNWPISSRLFSSWPMGAQRGLGAEGRWAGAGVREQKPRWRWVGEERGAQGVIGPLWGGDDDKTLWRRGRGRQEGHLRGGGAAGGAGELPFLSRRPAPFLPPLPSPLPGFLPSWPGSPFSCPPPREGKSLLGDPARRQREAIAFLEGAWSSLRRTESCV